MSKILQALLAVCLTVLTGEVLCRRLLWKQIPSQVSPFFVYGVLVFNLLFLAYWGRAILRERPSNRHR